MIKMLMMEIREFITWGVTLGSALSVHGGTLLSSLKETLIT
jgi:hypothetical protein